MAFPGGDRKASLAFLKTPILSLWLFFWLLPLSFLAPNELQYYIENLKPPRIPPLADTLFEKTVWERKVSHLVLEEKGGRYYVTLLMMERFPYNYKSQNYPIHYVFDNLKDAIEKFHFLDRFLQQRGVLRVKIHNNVIIEEKVLFPGYPELPRSRQELVPKN